MDDLARILIEDVLADTSPESVRRIDQAISDLDQEIEQRQREDTVMKQSIFALEAWVEERWGPGAPKGNGEHPFLASLARRRIDTLRGKLQTSALVKMETKKATLEDIRRNMLLDRHLVDLVLEEDDGR